MCHRHKPTVRKVDFGLGRAWVGPERGVRRERSFTANKGVIVARCGDCKKTKPSSRNLLFWEELSHSHNHAYWSKHPIDISSSFLEKPFLHTGFSSFLLCAGWNPPAATLESNTWKASLIEPWSWLINRNSCCSSQTIFLPTSHFLEAPSKLRSYLKDEGINSRGMLSLAGFYFELC